MLDDDDARVREAVEHLREELDRTIASVLCADLLPGVRDALCRRARNRAGGSRDAAADLVAAAEARACERFHQFEVRRDLRKDFQAWVFAILDRLATDATRAPGARDVSLDQPAIPGAGGDAPPYRDILALEARDLETEAIRSTVSEELARAGFWEALRSAGLGLAPLDRAIIQLAYLGEDPLPNREVAEILGTSRGTVAVQKHRALAALRSTVEAWCARDPRNPEILRAFLEDARNR